MGDTGTACAEAGYDRNGRNLPDRSLFDRCHADGVASPLAATETLCAGRSRGSKHKTHHPHNPAALIADFAGNKGVV